MHESTPRARLRPKQLLIASIGVATLNYTGACKEQFSTAVSNLMAAPVSTPFGVEADPTATQAGNPSGTAGTAPAAAPDDDAGVEH